MSQGCRTSASTCRGMSMSSARAKRTRPSASSTKFVWMANTPNAHRESSCSEVPLRKILRQGIATPYACCLARLRGFSPQCGA